MKCDELEAYKGDVTIPVYGTIADAQVYLKSEADKVIAELEKEIDQLQDKVTELLLRDRSMAINFNNAVDALGHSKYKRCMAMASKCRLRARWFGDNAFYKKEQWALKWHRRWLELAEQFKEAR